mmetsp:Transcript_4558/g.16342  ORF Transcript_4558/g.16342 Transcript_4558/m.16342 type:complete len:281 (-) Transcript_4558:3347-4189(-)
MVRGVCNVSYSITRVVFVLGKIGPRGVLAREQVVLHRALDLGLGGEPKAEEQRLQLGSSLVAPVVVYKVLPKDGLQRQEGQKRSDLPVVEGNPRPARRVAAHPVQQRGDQAKRRLGVPVGLHGRGVELQEALLDGWVELEAGGGGVPGDLAALDHRAKVEGDVGRLAARLHAIPRAGEGLHEVPEEGVAVPVNQALWVWGAAVGAVAPDHLLAGIAEEPGLLAVHRQTGARTWEEEAAVAQPVELALPVLGVLGAVLIDKRPALAEGEWVLLALLCPARV